MSTKKEENDFPSISAEEYETTETLKEKVEPETPIKEWLVSYVGEKHSPEDGEVTVEMMVETMAVEFPEFLLALAEENWIRGYRQGISDVEHGMKLAAEEKASPNDDGSSSIISFETDQSEEPDEQ